jgi:two-component system chemotaxis response regulator CheY
MKSPAKSVLLVDDAPVIRGIMRRALTRNGYEVAAEARDGRQALEHYKSLHPDLVILDINIPRMNGRRVLQEILATNPRARVLVVTAHAPAIVRQEILDLGARAVLGKPFRAAGLLKVVQQVLGG